MKTRILTIGCIVAILLAQGASGLRRRGRQLGGHRGGRVAGSTLVLCHDRDWLRVVRGPHCLSRDLKEHRANGARTGGSTGPGDLYTADWRYE